MTEETKREICKSFAYNIPIDTMCEVYRMTKDELIQFADDHKEMIAEAQNYNRTTSKGEIQRE